MLLSNTDLETAKTISVSVSQLLLMPTYIIKKDGNLCILAGDFFSRINTVKMFYNDAWITRAYHQYVVYPLPAPETESIDLSELVAVVQDLKQEIQEAKSLMTEMLNETIDIKEYFTKEPDPVLSVPDVSRFKKTKEPAIPTEDDTDLTRKVLWKLIYAGGVFVDLHAENPQLNYLNY